MGRMNGDVDRRGLLEEPAECSVLFFYRRTCVKENIRFSLVAPASASICDESMTDDLLNLYYLHIIERNVYAPPAVIAQEKDL